MLELRGARESNAVPAGDTGGPTPISQDPAALNWKLSEVGRWGHLSIVKSVQARSDLPFGLLAPGDGKEASTFSNSRYGVC